MNAGGVVKTDARRCLMHLSGTLPSTLTPAGNRPQHQSCRRSGPASIANVPDTGVTELRVGVESQPGPCGLEGVSRFRSALHRSALYSGFGDLRFSVREVGIAAQCYAGG